jgi:prepilin-type N-terminal cleavage/methylation domain-containing protein
MNKQYGFSLIELTIVLLIVALLLGGMLMPLSAQNERRNSAETYTAENEIRDALLGYALIYGYLPCPAPTDLSTAGAEAARVSGACPARVGLVPWATLGTGRLDSWGHYYRYGVSPAFSNSATKFTLTTTGDITIQTRNATGALLTLATATPATVVSFGNNAAWALGEGGTIVTDQSATNVDEDTNGNGLGTTVISRNAITQTTAPGGEFDDLVVWLSPNILFNRMVAAGKLP